MKKPLQYKPEQSVMGLKKYSLLKTSMYSVGYKVEFREEDFVKEEILYFANQKQLH